MTKYERNEFWNSLEGIRAELVTARRVGWYRRLRAFLPLVFLVCIPLVRAQAQTGQVTNAMDGLCLTVNGPVAYPSRLMIAACTANNPAQNFTRTGTNELRIAGTLCVDAYSGGHQAAEIGLYPCQASPNERWTPTATRTLVTENGFCMAVDGGRRAAGTRIIAYSCYPTDASQQWSGPAAMVFTAQAPAQPARPPVQPAPVQQPPVQQARVQPQPVQPQPVQPAPVQPAPVQQPPVQQQVTRIQADPGNISAACQMEFGRACAVAETSSVSSGTPAQVGTRDAIMAILRTQVAQSASIRDSIITRAVDLTYGTNTRICTEAWTALRAAFSTNITAAGTWGGLNQLYYPTNGQPAMLPAVVRARCGAVAPRPPGQAFDASVANAACQTMFGRNCATDESSQLGSAVGGNNSAAMQAFLRDRIAASPAYKDTIITAAFTAVMGARQICSEEMVDLRARFSSSTPQPGVTWNGFAGLTTPGGGLPALVQGRAVLCVAAAPATISSATLSMIAGSYPLDFGRPATTQETTAWARVSPTDPRIANRNAFYAYDVGLLKSNAAERQAMIARAYQATWNIALPANSKEMQYWDPVVANGQAVFSSLKHANDVFKTANPAYRPGQPITVRLTTSYGLLDVDVLAMLTGISAFLNKGMMPATPATGPLPAPPVSKLPRMRTPNPTGVNGPFVIAATSDERPDLSFCLDVTSLAAGTTAIAALCHPETQRWTLDGNSIKLTSNPNLCLDGGDRPWSIDPRHKVPVINPCSGSSNQKWYNIAVAGSQAGAPYTQDHWHAPPPVGQIQNAGTGMCLNVEGAKTDQRNPNTVIMFDCYTFKENSIRPWNTMWGAGNMMDSGAIYIFSRLDSPPVAGHTGWAVELADGSWLAGTFDSDEQTDGPGQVHQGHDNGAWRHRFTGDWLQDGLDALPPGGPSAEADLRAWFLGGKVGNPPLLPDYPTGKPQMGYDRYTKWEFSGNINTAAVFSLEAQSWDWGYLLLGNNCADVTYKILKAYGFSGISSLHDQNVVYPNIWFDNVRGTNTLFALHPAR